MNKLLSFNPEPFETEEEAEFSSRRSRGRSQYPRSRYARPQRGYARAAGPRLARLQRGYTGAAGPRLAHLQRGYTGAAGPRSARSPQSITPGSIQPSGWRPTPPDRRRPPPYGWFPTYPLVAPAWPVAVAPDGPPDEPAAPAPLATGPAAQPEPSGSASEHARWVQSCLNQVMGLRLPVNGVMSPETRSAVRSFQERQGLRIDGLVGPETERALAEACKGASAPEPAPVAAGNGGASAPEPAPAVAGNGGAGEIEARELPRAADAGLLARGRRRLPSRPAAPPTAAPAPFDSEAFRQRIVRIANQELARWGRGRIKETDPRIRRVLQDYWKTGTGADYSDAQLGDSSFQTDHPWSAAFISWVMKTAGAGPAFKYSSAHSTYTRWAKDNRVGNADNPFKAYRTTEIVPQVGDIICRSRAGSGANYDNIRPGMKTHCDIVTEVRPGGLIAIGGNVANSVSQKTLRTDAGGRLADPNYFAVIRVGAIQPSVPVAPTPTPVGPSASNMPRLIRQESVPAGTTLYVEIDLQIVDKFGITAPTVTGIFIPDGYAPSQTADLILYLHGHKAEALRRQGIDQYWNSQRFPYGALREHINDSGRNVILVAPSLGSRKPDV
jgi:peptidoglycan hydrolase-like protein with peptidoglycan-binding domain